MRKCNAKAFTLIELLVVIAIIALLMAILIPTLHRVKRQTYAVMCRSNLRQWADFFCMYTEDNHGKWFYHRTEHKNPGDFHFFAQHEVWFTVMRPYYKDCSDVLLCPEAAKPKPEADNPYGMGGAFHPWRTFGLGVELVGSYGLNTWLYDTGPDRRIWFPNKHHEHELWGTTQVKGASNVPVFFDCAVFGDSLGGFIEAPPLSDDRAAFDAGAGGGSHINRHGGGINMLFMDWSVRKVGLKELWTLKWHRCFNTANRWTKAGGVKPEDWPEWMRKFRDY